MSQKIVIDTLGSDQGPLEILKGCQMILDEFKDITLVIAGDETTIKSNFSDLCRIEILNCPETITNYDNPMEALFKKPNASILQAQKYASENDDVIGLITAGSSGAILCGCIKYLLNENRDHPCMGAILPNMQGAYTCLVDTGATIDCNSAQLVAFAHLGSNFMRSCYGIEAPRIGLLSNGAEASKGNHLVKETHKLLLEEKDLNFIGNIEGNKTLAGDCDVLVCDGFAGNQVLKNSEGMAVNLITEIMKFAKKNNMMEQAGAIVNHLMKTYDFSSLGGGIVLGAKKMVMKCRGNSGALAIKNTAHILVNVANHKTIYDGQEDARK